VEEKKLFAGWMKLFYDLCLCEKKFEFSFVVRSEMVMVGWSRWENNFLCMTAADLDKDVN
jgi:hypothetical protein